MSNHNPYQTPESGLALEVPADLEYDTTPVFSPNGRMGRVSYIAWSGIAYFAFIIALFLGLFMVGGVEAGQDGFLVIYAVLIIPFAVIYTIFGIRRLHDLDRSGWQYLLMVIPLVNLYIALVMLLQPGTEGENRFGGPRLTAPWEKVVAILGLALFVVMTIAPFLLPSFGP